MNARIQKAARRLAHLRLALVGPAGSGKTMTALRVGTALLPPGGRLLLIDTEKKSGALYAGEVVPEAPAGLDYDVLELEGNQSPSAYRAALEDAAADRYAVVVVDSLSHAWTGVGGALDQVDQATTRGRRGEGEGNSFAGWRTVTPDLRRLVEALLGYPGHLIVTLRVKTEYVMEKNDQGKTVPRKVGIQPIFRDGIEYEFTVTADLDQDHLCTISKTRCSALDGWRAQKPGGDLARRLLAWLQQTPVAPPATPTAPSTGASSDTAPVSGTSAEAGAGSEPRGWAADDQAAFEGRLIQLGYQLDDVAAWCVALGRPHPGDATPAKRQALLDYIADKGAEAFLAFCEQRKGGTP